jgi:hypothetical protein
MLRLAGGSSESDQMQMLMQMMRQRGGAGGMPGGMPGMMQQEEPEDGRRVLVSSLPALRLLSPPFSLWLCVCA